MDNNKIGKFIASLRKEKGLTQQELGDRLFVTDKAVSKWERGLSLPDISLLKKLAKELGVEVTDILDGKKGTTRKIDIEKELEELTTKSKRMSKKEFKKMLREEKHHITKGLIYEILFVVIFILLCALLVILQNKELLQNSLGLILTGILILIGIPYFIIDIKRDKKIKEMYEYYKKENKILEVKDNSKKIKLILIIEIVCALLIGGFIMSKYDFSEKRPITNEIRNNYIIELKDGKKIETKWYDFDNANFALKVPNDFYAMDKDMINKKYPSNNPPTYVLSNEKTTINIAVNITNNLIKNSQIKGYINLMEKELTSMADIIETSFFERDGHEIGEIKFVSKAVDTDIYNHMIAFSDDGYLRIVSFNCTKELQENWKEVGEFIMNSITFK